MYKIKTDEWDEILSTYKDFSEFWHVDPMIELVTFIKDSKYAYCVHAYTSMATLCIGQYEEIEEANALLKVECLPPTNEVSFSYKGDNTLEFTWHKTFPDVDICKEFEVFISELKWML